jgi:hypothetical protein
LPSELTFLSPTRNRERIYVVQEDDLKFLVGSYAVAQAAKGWKQPRMVRSLGEAFDIFGVTPSEFVPLLRS